MIYWSGLTYWGLGRPLRLVVTYFPSMRGARPLILEVVGRVDRLGAVGGESGILLGRRSQRPNFGDVLLFWKHMSNLSGHVL
jgi:hypothetical protein